MTEAISGHRRGSQGSLSGRQAEAARNDQRILDSARKVFVADPGAPITAVAKHAGVGISALYTRYASKEELLRKISADGLATFVTETETALEAVRSGGDHWEVFAQYMGALIDADTSSMTLALAGKFAPTPEMFALADHSSALSAEFFGAVRDVLREDLDVYDVGIVFEMIGAIKFSSPERTYRLRHRYLAMVLDGMRASGSEELPGPPPTWQEVSERWNPA